MSIVAFILFAARSRGSRRDPAWARPHRLQSRAPREQQLVGPSIGWWIVNNLSSASPRSPRGRSCSAPVCTPARSRPGGSIAGELVFFVYLDDLLYYWFHRTMHGRWLYKHVHGWHHRIVTPWAITGHYMHPVEYVLTGTIALHRAAPRGSARRRAVDLVRVPAMGGGRGSLRLRLRCDADQLFPGNDGARHHDFHHARVRGTTPGFFPIWDGVFGTSRRATPRFAPASAPARRLSRRPCRTCRPLARRRERPPA